MVLLRIFFSFLGLVGSTFSGTAAARAGDEMPALQAEPDHPINFGFKICWFAIRTTDGAAIGRILGLRNQQPANWASGIAFAYDAPEPKSKFAKVFVSPPVDGWTLVIGFGLPYPADVSSEANLRIGRDFRRHFLNLASHFDDVQFFGTYRVVGFNAWARARGGHVERVFSMSDGEVLANEGPQSSEEAHLGLLDLGNQAPVKATAFLFEHMSSRRSQGQERSPIPDEQDTIDMAGAWSIDPTQLESMMQSKGVGLVGLLPFGQPH